MVAYQTIASNFFTNPVFLGSFPGLLGGVAWAAVGGKGVWIVGGEDEEQKPERRENEKGTETTTEALTVSNVLAHLRATTGTGRTVLRVRASDSWLKKRNPLVMALDVKEGDAVKVVVCEAGKCRDVKGLKEL